MVKSVERREWGMNGMQNCTLSSEGAWCLGDGTAGKVVWGGGRHSGYRRMLGRWEELMHPEPVSSQDPQIHWLEKSPAEIPPNGLAFMPWDQALVYGAVV